MVTERGQERHPSFQLRAETLQENSLKHYALQSSQSQISASKSVLFSLLYAPERRALCGRALRLSSPLLPSKMGFMPPKGEPSETPRTFLKNCSES